MDNSVCAVEDLYFGCQFALCMTGVLNKETHRVYWINTPPLSSHKKKKLNQKE